MDMATQIITMKGEMEALRGSQVQAHTAAGPGMWLRAAGVSTGALPPGTSGPARSGLGRRRDDWWCDGTACSAGGA